MLKLTVHKHAVVIRVTGRRLTPKYMLESPLETMKIFGYEFLSWGLLGHILMKIHKRRLENVLIFEG